MQALADYAQCEWQRWPDQAPSVVAAWRNQLALQLAKRRGTVERYPERHELDYATFFLLSMTIKSHIPL